MQIEIQRILIRKGEKVEGIPIKMPLERFKQFQAFIPKMYEEQEVGGKTIYSKTIYATASKEQVYSPEAELGMN